MTRRYASRRASRVERAAQRRQPDPAGGHDHVAALGRCQRPRGAALTPDSEHAASLERADGAVVAPTARTVWTRRSSCEGSPLIEIGTSPAPNAYTIVNWPGAQRSAPPAAGSSVHVLVRGPGDPASSGR